MGLVQVSMWWAISQYCREQDPRLLQWDGACPVCDWHVALAVEMKMNAVMTVNSRHNSYLRFRDSSHLSSLAAVLLVTVKVCQHSLSYFHFYYETRTRLPGEQMGKQRYYNGICQIILHMHLSLKILTHLYTHTHICIQIFAYIHEHNGHAHQEKIWWSFPVAGRHGLL